MSCISHFLFFFFNDTATTEIYTLSLHDALPICYGALAGDPGPTGRSRARGARVPAPRPRQDRPVAEQADRKSTRLNSSHDQISYAVFCLKKKKKQSISRAIISCNNYSHRYRYTQ